MSNQEGSKNQEQTEEEEKNEEEQEASEAEGSIIYNCPCHFCGDDSIVPATIGFPAPKFHIEAVMPDYSFCGIELSSYQKQGKWLVMFSIPSRKHSINASEIVAFNENYSRFQDINADIIMIIPENIYVINSWCLTPKAEGGIENISYPLGSDISYCIHKRYGFVDDDNIYRGTVIIDPDGIVKHISLNDQNVGRSVEEILRLLKGYQYAKENGEVCPAMWKEGDPTIKPNITDSKEYFAHKYE
ncbi:peroxiredoxin [Tritrichomonas musculus]|uniref:Peroxiredoxin n=1 Tax=Tritrichomonas musculus TaxID=1915356 RepID=A0ABR2GYV3_9EUKA